MNLLTRRQFLGTAAAGALGSASLSGKTLRTIGVQLYTVRDVIAENTTQTLQALEAIGFREAECVYGNLDKVYAALKQTKIRPVSLHLDTAMFTADGGKLAGAMEDAGEKGFRFVVCPYVAPKDRGGEDVMKRLGETLNKAGETARKSGMRLCYHNHAFEFEPAQANQTLLDVLLASSDPKLVSLELDIMWAQVAGVSPVSVLRKYGKRVALMHLKDVARDVPRQYKEGIAREGFREVGNGVIDFRAVLQAAADAGVQHYFVEQDQTPGDPVASLRQSYGYLQKLDF